LAVLSGSEGDILASWTFGVLTLAFFFALFISAIRVRTLYWVPVPVSIKLTNQTYRPVGASRLLPGFGAAESAVFRKDLRSLTRRREMARLLAIPFVLAISLGVSLFPIGGTSVPDTAGFYVLIPVYVMPVAIFCSILAMTSMGQEGSAVWNLYIAPLTPKQLVKVKIVIPIFLGLTFSLALLIFLGLILRIALVNFLILFGLSVAVVIFESSVGLYFAAKFPDFRDVIRSRFVSVWGSLFGTFISLVLVGIAAAPLLISIMLQGAVSILFVVCSFAIGLIIFLFSWRLATQQMTKLLQEIPV
jgi:hypothetical protein